MLWAVLLTRGLDSLPSLKEKGILKFTKISSRITSDWCTPAEAQPWLGGAAGQWPSPDLIPIEMQWNDLKRAVHTRHPESMAELKCSISPFPLVSGMIVATGSACLRLLLQKEVLPVIKWRGFTYFSCQDIKDYKCLCVNSLFVYSCDFDQITFKPIHA